MYLICMCVCVCQPVPPTVILLSFHAIMTEQQGVANERTPLTASTHTLPYRTTIESLEPHREQEGTDF